MPSNGSSGSPTSRQQHASSLKFSPSTNKLGDGNPMHPQHPPSSYASSSPRRRAYSWKGERPPYEPKSDKPCDVNPPKLLAMISQESRCVSAWVVSCATIQVIVSILVKVASYAYSVLPAGVASSSSSNVNVVASKWDGFVVGPSVIAGCLLRLVPSQVITQEAPGFIYASAWFVELK
jgi:hypothetical protein